MTGPGPVLILGGTAEGRELATALHDLGVAAISSLAGRVTSPRLPPGPVRIGGFGGPDGLAEYLVQENVSAVVDATHPFAARITANAATACARTGVPLLIRRRPSWTPTPDDHWIPVPDLPAAAEVVAGHCPDAVVLLTVGRQGVGAFSAAPQRFWLRSVEPPEPPLPPRGEILLDRGPFTESGERELMQRLAVEILVTKNSGGPLTSAKLSVARELSIPVIMVDRPPAPTGIPSADDLPATLGWLAHPSL